MVTPSPRRIGAPDSKTRARLVEAAEQLLLDEGSAAVTSRRVGAKAGLKPQLVHYYFRSMEDLFVEVFRRRADESLARAERALAESSALRTIWEINADPRGAAFNIEFVALAKHHPVVRSEVARYAERYRAMQLQALGRALEATGVSADDVPPMAALLLMTGLTQVLALEQTLGVTAGHEESVSFVTRLIDRLESGQAGGR
ncbi:MAG TPA: TetR/AcrR family transcriptional regulator [Acidimicrobiales bacterium]|nr:TetR/AcrR family transcriptional regulator [Acidimicrobiales bacterium]